MALMRASDKLDHVRGIVVLDESGKVLTSHGIGSDPRIRAATTDKVWLAEARTKRVMPFITNDMKVSFFVKDIADCTLLVISEIPTDTVLSFLITVDFAYDILDQILTDPYD